MCCSSKFEACICFEGKGQRREEKLGTTREEEHAACVRVYPISKWQEEKAKKKKRKGHMRAYPSIATGGVSLDVSVGVVSRRRPIQPTPAAAAPPCRRHGGRRSARDDGALFPSLN